ncbi:ragulator complex protein LAMTOR3-B-like [Paramacrobiotus metropolitanus]|uniref:ragulator complex protein LAMTOR3-B-like n=1 Tax=Paramacrobiotus metropolitanus TaxID=2943436 RepID=UPI002446003F|nr:ragulator complex protein LAMTOR3-B-like [Paramacrobiotus metropolitanus]
MTEDLRKHIQETIRSVPGVRGVVIADRDGVPILRVHDETVPETVMRPPFLSSVGFATDQASRLGYGKTNYVISIHERHQMVHFNLTGIILTVIADVESNTGLLLTLSNDLTDVTDSIRNALQLTS